MEIMNTRHRFSRGSALLVAVAVLLGLVQELPGSGTLAYAAESGTAATPSVTVYAEHATLTGSTFDPGSSGTAAAIGKLRFGYRGTEWYILGKDSQVKDANNKTDNIVIFATNNMTRFNGDTYRYAVSDFRSAIQDIEWDNYFYESERKLLQASTVANTDFDYLDWETESGGGIEEKSNVVVCTDKLYPAYSPHSSNTVIYIGSWNSKLLPIAKYCTAGEDFWLRYDTLDKCEWSRNDGYNYLKAVFIPNSGSEVSITQGVTKQSVSAVSSSLEDETDKWKWTARSKPISSGERGVRPASNINVANVLFASAAPAATSVTASGGKLVSSGSSQAAMTLRMDGSDQDIGTFEYGEDGIKVSKGSAYKVSLVVQGRNGSTDWYFNKRMAKDNETISIDDIAEKTGVDASAIDLTSGNCKIWLETPSDDNSTISYAVTKTEAGQEIEPHVHQYAETKATPSELMKSNATEHWWGCMDESCPDPDGSRLNMAGEPGTDKHNWVETQEEAEKDLECFKDYFKDKPKFLEKGTGSVYYLANEETKKCDKVTTYYVYCQDCERVDTTRTFQYTETFDHVFREDHDGWTRVPKYHIKQCIHCYSILDMEEHVYDDDDDPRCNICDYNRAHDHFPLIHVERKEPTCTEDGNIDYYYCGDDGCDLISQDSLGTILLTEPQTILKATGHDMSYHAANAPTCTEAGNVEYYECSKCGLHFTNEAGNEELSDILLPAAGHNIGDWQSDATKHWKECTVCGEKFEEGAHYYVLGTCSYCGYTSSVRNTDKYNTGAISGGSGGGGGGGGTSTVAYVNKGSDTDGSTPNRAVNGSGCTWEQNTNGGWKCKYANGQYAAGTKSTGADGSTIEHPLFVKIGDAVWAFGADEYLIVGWVQDADGRWWYIDIDRGLLLGWIYDTSDSNWYYCNESDGMLTGWFWDTEASCWYYLDTTTGAMLTGYQTIDGKQYYFSPAPSHPTYSFNTASARWYYDNPYSYSPLGSTYIS